MVLNDQRRVGCRVSYFVTIFSLLPTTFAVLHGDEQFGEIPGGRFWAFHSAGVSIVDPDQCRVEHSITKDHQDEYLPDAWNDGVYMEHSVTGHGYVLINSGITKDDTDGASADGGTGEVLVFSTNPQHKYQDRHSPVLSRIQVGGDPWNAYGVYTHNQVRRPRFLHKIQSTSEAYFLCLFFV